MRRVISIFTPLLLLLLWAAQSSKAHLQEKRNNLNGTHILVLMDNFPPVSVLIRNTSGDIIGTSGSLPDQIDWISKKLNFDYDITTPPKIIPGPNETRDRFTETYRLVSEEIVDISTGPFATTRDKIALCGLIGGAGSLILVKYPKSTEKSIYATIEPFEYQIWIAIIGSLGAATLTCFFIFYIRSRFMKKNEMHKKNVYEMFLYFFKMIIAQGCQLKKSTYAIGIVAFSWSIVAFVTVNAYNSSVISYLSFNYKKPEVSTFKDLADNNNYNVLTLKGTVMEIDIQTATSIELKTVAEKMRRCSDCRMNDFISIAERVMGGNFAAVLPDIICNSLVDEYYSKRGECELTVGKDNLQWHHMFAGVPKSSPYQEEFNRESLWYMAHGLWDYWEKTREYKGTADKCYLKYNRKGVETQSAISPIQLKQLFVPFVILLCGWLIGFFLFLRERMYDYLRSQEEAENVVDSRPAVNVVDRNQILVVQDVDIHRDVAATEDEDEALDNGQIIVHAVIEVANKTDSANNQNIEEENTPDATDKTGGGEKVVSTQRADVEVIFNNMEKGVGQQQGGAIKRDKGDGVEVNVPDIEKNK